MSSSPPGSLSDTASKAMSSSFASPLSPSTGNQEVDDLPSFMLLLILFCCGANSSQTSFQRCLQSKSRPFPDQLPTFHVSCRTLLLLPSLLADALFASFLRLGKCTLWTSGEFNCSNLVFRGCQGLRQGGQGTFESNLPEHGVGPDLSISSC